MRTLLLVAIGALALGAAGLAVAKNGSGSVAAATGTFTATTVSKSEQKTCTTTDGKTLQQTNATYTGLATGTGFAGPVTVQARSTLDTTASLGVVRGTVRFGPGGGSQAQFTAVYDHGDIAGLATSHGKSLIGLVANLSAGFSPATGFTNGKIGSSAGGSAVVLGPGKCSSSTGSREDDGKDRSGGAGPQHGQK